MAELDEEDKEENEEDKDEMDEGETGDNDDTEKIDEKVDSNMDEDAKIAAEYGLDDYDDGWLISLCAIDAKVPIASSFCR